MFPPVYQFDPNNLTDYDWEEFGRNMKPDIVNRFKIKLNEVVLKAIMFNKKISIEDRTEILEINFPIFINGSKSLWYSVFRKNQCGLFISRNIHRFSSNVISFLAEYFIRINAETFELCKPYFTSSDWLTLIKKGYPLISENTHLFTAFTPDEQTKLNCALTNYKSKVSTQQIRDELINAYSTRMDIYRISDGETLTNLIQDVDSFTDTHWKALCCNEHAIPILMKYRNKITPSCIYYLVDNPNAAPFIESMASNLTEYNWECVMMNPNLHYMFEKYFNLLPLSIIINMIHRVKNSIKIIKSNYSVIIDNEWEKDVLCKLTSISTGLHIIDHLFETNNPILQDNEFRVLLWESIVLHRKAHYLINKYADKAIPSVWSRIALQPRLMHLIAPNINRFTINDMEMIVTYPSAIPIIEKRLHLFNQDLFDSLACNPAATKIIKNNFHKLSSKGFNNLCLNPCVYKIKNIELIFEVFKVKDTCGNYKKFVAKHPHSADMMFHLNQNAMMQQNKEFAGSLIRKVFDPNYIFTIADRNNIEYDEIFDMY